MPHTGLCVTASFFLLLSSMRLHRTPFLVNIWLNRTIHVHMFQFVGGGGGGGGGGCFHITSHHITAPVLLSTSGDTYSAVPTNEVARAEVELRAARGRNHALALPKSMSFRWPAAVSSRFSGFRSLHVWKKNNTHTHSFQPSVMQQQSRGCSIRRPRNSSECGVFWVHRHTVYNAR